MKYITLLILSFIVGGQLQAQQPVKVKEVPEAVKKSYISQNSTGAKDTLWEKQMITIYKVKFMDGNQQYEAQYYEDGKWIKTFTQIAISELPLLAINQLKTTYPEFTITSATIELSEKGRLYAVELKKGKSTIIEYFYSNGSLYR
ncbi:MAG: PepSY-like domain-containing protein [Bacteroidia bacterium]|nr:PepSY-like domain-containing protein [Bacteroidia bacterium]